VLVYNPKKRRGKFAKWEVRWVGPYVVQNKLNSTNYVVKKGRSKSIVIHIDRLRKLPAAVEADHAAGLCTGGADTAACPTAVTRKSDFAGTTDISVSTETGESRPLTRSSRRRAQLPTTPPSLPGLGLRDRIPLPDQRSATPVAAPLQPAASADKPRPPARSRPVREHRRPARYVQLVQARLTNQACQRDTAGRPAQAAVIRSVETESGARALKSCLCCSIESVVNCKRGVMPCSTYRRTDADGDGSESDSDSLSSAATVIDRFDVPTPSSPLVLGTWVYPQIPRPRS